MNSKIFLIVIICFFLITLVDKNKHFNLSNFPKKTTSPVIETDCRFQPKKCPFSGIKCDCQQYCQNKNAKLFKRNDEFLCYIPHYYFGCNQEYGTYVFDGVWKCFPKYNNVFTTSGEQISGKYPHTKANTIERSVDYNDPSQYEIDCSGLYDEYGNNLIKVVINGGITFCVKDYCLNNTPKNPARGYNPDTGLCDCTNNTQNVDVTDQTTPCVVVRNKSHYQIPFKIICFKENSFVKDMSNYLIPCPEGEDYVASKDHDIKIVKMHL